MKSVLTPESPLLCKLLVMCQLESVHESPEAALAPRKGWERYKNLSKKSLFAADSYFK